MKNDQIARLIAEVSFPSLILKSKRIPPATDITETSATIGQIKKIIESCSKKIKNPETNIAELENR